MAARRWIRLDVTSTQTEWVAGLKPAGRLAWIELLKHIKVHGKGGRSKAIATAVFSRMYDIPAKDVQAMLEAAKGEGALQTEAGEWVVVKWAQYQEPDQTATERKRRQRSRNGHAKSQEVTHGHDVTTVTDGVTRHATTDITDVVSSSRTETDVKKKVINLVFVEWVKATHRDPARTTLTKKRREKIQARLQTFSPDDLKLALAGLMLSEFHRSKPEYTELSSCFGSDEKVENHIARAREIQPPEPPVDRQAQLHEALEQVIRQDPEFRGGMPDPFRTGIEIAPRDRKAWLELLSEKGYAA